jgi:hypothetical protein
MDPIEHLKDAQDIRFDSGASSRIRERLVAHMRANPIQTLSPYQRFFMHSPYMSHLRMPAMALALLLVIGVGGATSYAAAGALPGDPLYPVKVSIIEPARVLLATTPEEKAAVNVSIALTRAHEAEQLAVKGKLDAQDTDVQKGFDTSLGKAKATLAVLSEKDPAAAASLESSLDISLDAHEAVIDTLSAAKAATGARELAFHVKEKGKRQDAAASVRKAAEPVEMAPIRAAVMMTALAPEPVATTSSTTVSEEEPGEDNSSDERSRAVEKEKDSILRSLGL